MHDLWYKYRATRPGNVSLQRARWTQPASPPTCRALLILNIQSLRLHPVSQLISCFCYRGIFKTETLQHAQALLRLSVLLHPWRNSNHNSLVQRPTEHAIKRRRPQQSNPTLRQFLHLLHLLSKSETSRLLRGGCDLHLDFHAFLDRRSGVPHRRKQQEKTTLLVSLTINEQNLNYSFHTNLPWFLVFVVRLLVESRPQEGLCPPLNSKDCHWLIGYEKEPRLLHLPNSVRTRHGQVYQRFVSFKERTNLWIWGLTDSAKAMAKNLKFGHFFMKTCPGFERKWQKERSSMSVKICSEASKPHACSHLRFIPLDVSTSPIAMLCDLYGIYRYKDCSCNIVKLPGVRIQISSQSKGLTFWSYRHSSCLPRTVFLRGSSQPAQRKKIDLIYFAQPDCQTPNKAQSWLNMLANLEDKLLTSINHVPWMQ